MRSIAMTRKLVPAWRAMLASTGMAWATSIMVASTVTLALVSGGFVAYELFTYRQSMTRDLITLAEIIGDRMQMLGSRSGAGEPREASEPKGEPKPAPAKKPAGKFDDMEDDIPF